MVSELVRGARLISTIVDGFAQSEPDKIYASLPIDDDDISKGFRNITYKQFSRAVNAASWWLTSITGGSELFETFAYFGPRDLRYSILIVAAVKTRRQLLLASLFASIDAHVALATKLECRTFVCSPEYTCLVRSISDELKHTRCVAAPDLGDWLYDPMPEPDYPFTKTYSEVKDDPVFVVHTSGTTGLPKPVVWTHAHISLLDCWGDLPDVDGFQPWSALFVDGTAFYCSLPIFHVVGITLALLVPCFFGVVVVLGPAAQPPSADEVVEIIRNARPNIAFLAPALLEAVARKSTGTLQLETLDLVCFTGAPLSRKTGDLLCKDMTMMNLTGATEGGIFPTLQLDSEDWKYHYFHPKMGTIFEPDGGTNADLYEMVFRKIPESNQATNIFRTFPDKDTHRTNDLWRPHPSKPNLWKFSGRTDDLVLLTGETKLYAQGIEEAVLEHSAINSVLVGGDGRLKPFMLIELRDLTAAANPEIMNDVWKHIGTVNSRNAETAVVDKALTFLTPAPFLMTPKGSLDRRRTFKLYRVEIDELYAASA